MFGAVLWNDRRTHRALIWCEDHGNLAFYEGEAGLDTEPFEEGDLVTFKVKDGRGMRVAFDVRVVSSEEYPYLADDLRGASAPEQPRYHPPQQKNRKIVAFEDPRPRAAQQNSPSYGSDCAEDRVVQLR